MQPDDVLRQWFAAHGRGDMEAARRLVDDDLIVVVPGVRLHGFDAFMKWYADRAEREGPSFGYAVDDVLGGESHAAAVLTLSSGDRSWRQVAVYAVARDRITWIWAVEEDER